MTTGSTAAVFLNYRTAPETVVAVRTLIDSGAPLLATIVIDNGSGDDSLEILRSSLPDVILLALKENGGFAAGCNVGIREALRLGAKQVLLVNSDALMTSDAIRALERTLESHPHLGIVGPMIVERSEPEVVQSLGIRYLRASGRMRHLGHGRTRVAQTIPDLREVDGVSGCAMLIARDVFERIGLFTEDYFFGFEDLDFCLRAGAAGRASACVGSTVVLHEGSRSIGRRSAQRIYFATRNHLVLADRFRPVGLRLVRWPLLASVTALNLGHVLLTSDVPIREGLRAFWLGIRDYRSRRFGRASA